MHLAMLAHPRLTLRRSLTVAAVGLASLLATAPALAEATRAERIRASLVNGPRDEVIIVAHRADWRNYPENSLPAINGAIALDLPMVEIDLQRTQDGQLVLMHDVTVDRTTTGKGKVADLTLEQIRTLYLRDGLGSPTAWRVPTLREALVAARGRVMLNLDKGFRYLAEIMPLLEETGTSGQVLLKGPGTVTEVRAASPDLLTKVAYMPVANFGKVGAPGFVREWVQQAKPCAIEFVFAEWSPELREAFALCRENGVRIWVNTLWPQLAGGLADDQALESPDGVYGVLLDRGVSMFQTDRPVLLKDYLAARKAVAAAE